jgi:uncharacterized protein YciI
MSLRLFTAFILATAALAQSGPAPATQPQFEVETFYMAIMRRIDPYDARKVEQLAAAQQAYWQTVADRGDLIAGGPTMAVKDTLAAVMIYRSADTQEAAKIANDDPVVRQKLWSAEVQPWMTQKGVLGSISHHGPSVGYFLGFLTRGENWSPDETPERQRIQDAHLANIKRLGEQGILVAAGPFTEDIDLRGIFVFKTATLEQANELTNTDPAVQAGRLKISLYPWQVPAESFRKK